MRQSGQQRKPLQLLNAEPRSGSTGNLVLEADHTPITLEHMNSNELLLRVRGNKTLVSKSVT